MAPEQTVSNDVDRRIDIFATGIVLHEILTGRRLFKGENDLQTIERVRQCEVPPPSLHNPLCPPELDSIVLQALAKHQEDRFQSAFEMADALDDVVHAARFQPAHLSQAMRTLFPAETGGTDIRSTTGNSRLFTTPLTGTASVSPSRSHSGSWPVSGSRSGANLVSATIPPVTGGPVLTSTLPLGPALPSQPPRKSFSRASIWAVGASVLILGAFLGGAAWMNRLGGAGRAHTSPPPAQQPPILTTTLNVNIQSNPPGADVFTAAGNVLLGRTPFRKQFIYQEALPTLVVFRLKGYRELVQEVRPGWSGEVVLQPDVAPPPAETPTTPTGKSKTRTKVSDWDPFERSPSGRRKSH
jgi:serine/threonine-protein kinase